MADDGMMTLGDMLEEVKDRPRELVPTDTEKALVAGLLLDGWRVADVRDRAGLQMGDFGNRTCGLIYGAMVDLASAGRPVDTITAAEQLQRSGHLEQIGGGVALSRLAASMPTSAHVEAYAGAVRDAAVRRTVIEALAEADTMARGRATLEELRAAVVDVFDGAMADGGATGPKHISEAIPAALDNLERKPEGLIPTGLRHLDDLLDGGFEPERLYVVAARPGMGKTAAGLCFAEAGARAGGAALWSAEMSAAQNAARMLVSRARVNRRALRGTAAKATQAWVAVEEAVGDVGELPLWIDDRSSPTLARIRSGARRFVRQHGVRVVIVDYLQLMEAEERPGRSTNDVVAALSKGLKGLARELHVPVVCLSQLNRKCEERGDKRPWVADLRDSGAIEQDADAILLMWRPGHYGEAFARKHNAPSEVQINVAKNRDGPTGPVWCGWSGEQTRLSDLPPGEWPRAEV